LNTTNIEAKRAQLDAEATELEAVLGKAIDGALEGKDADPALDLKDLGRRIGAVKDAKADLDRQEERHKAAEADPRIVALKSFGGDLGAEFDAPVTQKATGAQLSPLAFSDSSLKQMYKAFQNRQPFSIRAEVSKKAFSTVDSLLPAELAPGIIAHQHEWRILERLPAITIGSPSYEFLVHNFAGDTGTNESAPFAGVVAEGAAKPEYVPDATSSIATAVKIAIHTGISYESLADAPQWLSYVQTECMKQIMDTENQQLLYGTGSSGQILGFFNTSGILTHNVSSDPGGWTALDSIEASINTMRVGSSLSEPNLFICSPTTWSSIRRTKATTGQYIVGDPLHDAVRSIWGIPVLTTTACTDGQGLLLDTTKFGNALIREGIVMHQGFSGTDFVDNVARYVFEERLTLATERPQSVLAISNLPTT